MPILIIIWGCRKYVLGKKIWVETFARGSGTRLATGKVTPDMQEVIKSVPLKMPFVLTQQAEIAI